MRALEYPYEAIPEGEEEGDDHQQPQVQEHVPQRPSHTAEEESDLEVSD